MKIKLRRLHGKKEQLMLRCCCLLVRVIRCGRISQSASQSDADQWLKAWMLYLWLANSVGVYGAVRVDCGAVLLSQNGLPDSIPNAADIRILTMSLPECQV